MLEIKNSPIEGKGCFASVDIPVGTFIDEHVLLIEKHSNCLRDYIFSWDDAYKAIGATFVSFVNHSTEPNMQLKARSGKDLKLLFMTIKEIKSGDEILLDYKDLG